MIYMKKKNKLIINPSIRIKKLNKVALAVNINTFEYFEFNNFGKKIIFLVNGNRDTKDIINILTNRYKKHNNNNRKEIQHFLKYLIKKRIIINSKN